MDKEKFKNVTEVLHHLGEDDFPFGAVNPPIYQTANFSFKSFEDFAEALQSEEEKYIYTRGNNPTVQLLEEKLAELEHAEKAKLLSSGVAAISASILAFVQKGDHIICVRDAYSWTKTLLDSYLQRFGVDHTYIDGTNLAEFEEAIRENTKLIYLESPTTFSFQLQNLKEVAGLAREKGIKTVIDNTWATPIFQNPLDYGIDIVVHSASKYFGGNSDLVAGAIMGSKEDIDHIFKTEFLNIGTVPDPFMAWLILRGIRTLHIRVPEHYKNALKVIDFLASRPEVEEILYPFYGENPQYELACQQMRGGSGLFSFKLNTGDREIIKKFTNKLEVFKRAVSWGGYESLVFPYAVTSKNLPEERVSLIRLHVGLEDPLILIKDLEQALNSLNLPE